MQPEVLRKELLICVEMHLTKAIFTPYRVALAQARKPFQIGPLFTRLLERSTDLESGTSHMR